MSIIGSSILEEETYLNESGEVHNMSYYEFNCTYNETFGGYNEPQCHTNPGGSVWLRLIVILLYGIVCIVGLCGNTLVIYVVVRFSKMQTVTNLYIVNLAIADECFLVGIPFLMATTALEYWPFGNIMCKIYFTSTSINQVTSSMFLLIMSADRFLAVCHPISATKYRTPLIASIVALTAWSISAIIMTPIFIYTSTVILNQRISCNIFWPTHVINSEQMFILYSFFLGFLIPLLLISIFYVLVIMRLRHVGPKRGPQVMNKDGTNPLTSNQQNRARDRKKSHRKVTKLVLTVITVYFVCWAPYWISQLCLISMDKHSIHTEVVLITFLLTGLLSYSNSAMNPILYAFLSDNFKKSFLKACSCANKKDVNAALHVENSVFPRNKRGGGGSGGANEGERRGLKYTTASSRLLSNATQSGAQILNPPKIVEEPPGDDEGFLDSEDEGVAILGRSTDSALTSRPGISDVSKITQETVIQDGVHITAL